VPPATGGPHRNARGPQVAARRLATDAGGLLDAPERPTKVAKCQDLLSFLSVQDVRHDGGGSQLPRRRQRLGRQPLWPLFK
jgi:hypothetical protein